MNDFEQLKAELHTLKCKQITTTPFTGAQAISTSAGGADIADIEIFNEQFKIMIENMNVMLVTETKILAGTKAPTYAGILKEIETAQ